MFLTLDAGDKATVIPIRPLARRRSLMRQPNMTCIILPHFEQR